LFIGNKRFWHIPNVFEYINVLSQNQLPVAGEEPLNLEQKERSSDGR